MVTDSYYFVGPDNGLFSLVYQEAERIRVHHITSSHYYLPNPGPTFHGRDIFAPVAAWLTKGIPSGNFGEEITDFVKLNVPLAKKAENGFEGHVVHIDRFGNVITNITYKDIQSLVPEGGQLGAVSVDVTGKEIRGLKSFMPRQHPGSPAPSSTARAISRYSCSSRTPVRPFPSSGATLYALSQNPHKNPPFFHCREISIV